MNRFNKNDKSRQSPADTGYDDYEGIPISLLLILNVVIWSYNIVWAIELIA